MSLIDRFQRYADAFEETYVDDEWSRLSDFFSADAVYAVVGLPSFALRAEGREEVLDALRGSVNAFDRRCTSRRLELLAAPSADGDTVTIEWAGIYTVDGAPPLRVVGTETARYRGDHIVELIDRYPPATADTVFRWMEAHRSALGVPPSDAAG